MYFIKTNFLAKYSQKKVTIFGYFLPFVFSYYSIRPRCNCSMGNIKSQFFPQTMLPSSILNCRNLRSSRYLLYCGCGYRRMKAPISTICEVLSLKVRCTERLPASDALVIYKRFILEFSFNVCTAYSLLFHKEIDPFFNDILVILANKCFCHLFVF